MPRVLLSFIFVFAFNAAICAARGDEPAGVSLESRFTSNVRPFLKNYFFSCPGEKKQEAKLHFSGYSSPAAVVKNHRKWETVLKRLDAEEMPPENAPKQPTKDERRVVAEWIRALNEDLTRRNAGDPGPVPGRRLSHVEFDYTIRDLT